MNQQETLELVAKGKDAWNAWANEMLAKRAELEKAETWQANREVDRKWGGYRKKGENPETRAWLDAATSVFSGLHFGQDSRQETKSGEINSVSADSATPIKVILIEGCNFDDFIFPGETDFRKAVFSEAASFRRATFGGEASFSGATFGGDARFDRATFSSGGISFYRATFSGEATFYSATFCGETSFSSVAFGEYVSFLSATFREGTSFYSATFSASTRFESAMFSGNARFDRATFGGDANFLKAQFDKDASFAYSTFASLTTNFEGASFGAAANFRAIDAERAFNLGGARFVTVPDFVQAHFAEAPRLDDFELASSVEGGDFWRSIWHAAEKDVSAKYRAMRRLAVQGHDYENERMFLKGEIRSQRYTLDKPWYLGFWFGIAYDVLSDFGGSIARPVYWGTVWTASFAAAYYLLVFSGGPAPCGQSSLASLSQAFHLAIKNAVLLISWDGATDLENAAQCLKNAKAANGDVFGLGLNALQLFQKLGSLVLWFLLLLAVRNRFKLK
jgi:hypothetical protein